MRSSENKILSELMKKKEIWFPFNSIRQYQDQMMLSIYSSLQTSTPLFVHAPTGIGKTSAVLSVVLPFAKKNNLKVFFLTSRLLHHKLIQETIKMIVEKYNVSLKSAYIIGKRYLCSFDFAIEKNDFYDFCKKLRTNRSCEYYLNTFAKGTSLNPEILHEVSQYNVGDSELIRELFKGKFCPYEISLYLARDADIVVCDYNYILNPEIREFFLKKLGASLEKSVIIFDEGHNLPKRALEMTSGKITKFQLHNALIQLKEFDFEIEELNSLIEFLQYYYKKFLIINLMQYKHHFLNFDSDAQNVLKFKKTLEKKSLLDLEQMFDVILMNENEIVDQILINKDDIFRFLPNLDLLYEKLDYVSYEIIERVKKNFVRALAKNLAMFYNIDDDYFLYFSYSRDSKNYGIYIENLNANKLFQTINTDYMIFMSGTLKPVKMYQDIILKRKSNSIELNSSFPSKNKLEIIFTYTTSLYARRTEEEYEKIAKMIRELVEVIPGNVIVFFPSYYFLYKVKQKLETKKPLLYERNGITKSEKDELLDEFLGFSNFVSENCKGAVLLATSGGNFSEGVDFPGEYLKGVIIVGFPLTKPDLKTKALIKYYDKKFPKKGKLYAYIYPTIAKVMQNAGRCIRSETDKGVIVYMDERYKNYKDIFENVIIDPKNYLELIKSFFDEC